MQKKTVWQFNSKNYSYKSFHRVQQKVLLLINLPQNTRHGPTCCNHQDKTKKINQINYGYLASTTHISSTFQLFVTKLKLLRK